MPGSFVKLQFEEGEIDFVAAGVCGDLRGARCDRVSAEPGALHRGCHSLLVRFEGPMSRATLRATSRTARMLMLTVSSRPMLARDQTGN